MIITHILALSLLVWTLPLSAQRLPHRPCPQRERVNELREKTRKQMLASRARTKAGTAQPRNGLIILAAFSNQSFTKSKAYFDELINGTGASSALSYFNEQWNGYYDFHFDITDIVLLPNTYEYYGEEKDGVDIRAEEMIIDACRMVDADIDFSKYDNDGDKIVDNVFVFYAGDCGGGHDDRVWPHQWYVWQGAKKDVKLDEVRIDNYACTSEFESGVQAGIGTFCHEYTHTFGIPDLYDTDGEDNGYAEALWACIDLMDAGNYNDNGRTPPYYSALERWFYEMSPGKFLTEGEHTLEPVHKNGAYYLVPTDTANEVYLIECRSNEKWDKYIGGSGLMIYHVDITDASVTKYWEPNELNAKATHQCMDAIECNQSITSTFRKSGYRDPWNYFMANAQKVFWPDGGQNSFAASTTPAWKYWSGKDSPVAITNIRKNADGSVSFTVVGDAGVVPPSVLLQEQLTFQDASIIRWNTDDASYEGECVLRYKESDASKWTEKTVHPYEKGKFAAVVEGLKARTSYDVEINSSIKGIPGTVNKQAGFTTKRAARGGEYPYIYLKDVPRNEDGSFPSEGAAILLRLYNAPEGSVEWSFDGKPIQVGADALYHLTTSGELRAVVTGPSGRLVLYKKINVK